MIWAGNAIVNKLSFGIIAPEAIAFYRWFFAMLVLTPFMLKPVLKKRRTIIPLLPKLATLAALGMVLNQSLAYFAAATTTATNMALILDSAYGKPVFGGTFTQAKALAISFCWQPNLTAGLSVYAKPRGYG